MKGPYHSTANPDGFTPHCRPTATARFPPGRAARRFSNSDAPVVCELHNPTNVTCGGILSS